MTSIKTFVTHSNQEKEERKLHEMRDDSPSSQPPQSEEDQSHHNSEQIDKKVNIEEAKQLIKDANKATRNAISSIDETLARIDAFMNRVQQTTDTYEKFNEAFGKAISRFGQNLLQSVSYDQKPRDDEPHMKPKVSDTVSIVEELKTKSHFVFLTGAGLSAASGIPTFRGKGGYWTLKSIVFCLNMLLTRYIDSKEEIKATDFLTHQYFTENPQEIWRWHHEFKNVQTKKAPNVSHQAIAEFQVFCSQAGIKCSLVTQNIDGYHVQAYAKALTKPPKSIIDSLASLKPGLPTTTKTVKKIVNVNKKPMTTTAQTSKNKAPEEQKTNSKTKVLASSKVPMKKFGLCDQVFEIHGSIDYMRCENGCTTDLYEGPGVVEDTEFVPKCPKCQEIARPHTLFFDEGYEEAYYRGQSVRDEIESMDCLFVIGTALQTYLASQIVVDAIKKNVLIVEVNTEPIITYGNVRHLVGGAQQFIPGIFQSLPKKLIDRKKKVAKK